MYEVLEHSYEESVGAAVLDCGSYGDASEGSGTWVTGKSSCKVADVAAGATEMGPGGDALRPNPGCRTCRYVT